MKEKNFHDNPSFEVNEMNAKNVHDNPSFEINEVIDPKKDDIENGLQTVEDEEPEDTQASSEGMTYSIDDVPPWYLSCLLGMQHYLMMVGSTITVPFILTPLLCIQDNDPARSKITSSILFVSGIVTLLQSTFGVRLPIVQGATFGFLLPSIAILTTMTPKCDFYNYANMTSQETDEVWMTRMREIQGAIAVASLFQVFIGFTGLIGSLLTFITPLTIVPTVTLVGLSLFRAAADKASGNWAISILTVCLLILFSQYLANVPVPVPIYSREKGFRWKKFEVFKLFPVIMALLISWAVSAILTATGALSPDSLVRTDLHLSLVEKSPWFYVPYPFQWGLPTVSVSGVFGMLAGVIASMIESIGDYYACARLSGISPPPMHAMNRGVGVEGLGCVLAGLIGTGNGTTSYSENIGAIRVTKVASRRVIQYGAMIMILCGMFGKFGAVFVTLPSPVVGGIFLVMFSVISAVGLSNLQVVDLNSSRNLFVLGFSLFCGVAIPEWITSHGGDLVLSSNQILNQVLIILLSTHMFVGGFLGLILDNTIPGTDEERGLHLWNKQVRETSEGVAPEKSCYDFPYGMEVIRRTKWLSKVPFSPSFVPSESCLKRLKRRFSPNRTTPTQDPDNS